MSLQWMLSRQYKAAVVVHIVDTYSSHYSIDKEMTKVINAFKDIGFYTCSSESDMEDWDNEYSRLRFFITDTDISRDKIKEFVKELNTRESNFNVKASLLSHS